MGLLLEGLAVAGALVQALAVVPLLRALPLPRLRGQVGAAGRVIGVRLAVLRTWPAAALLV